MISVLIQLEEERVALSRLVLVGGAEEQRGVAAEKVVGARQD